jgi:putative ABC transport system ATP-binding protein
MIRLKNIRKVYRTSLVETLALNDVSLHIERGEFVSVMGPSGCGKSSLLNIIGLLDAPSAGIVEIDGSAVNSYSDKVVSRIRNLKIGFVFQSFHLINDLEVLDNVELPLLYRNISETERRKRAAEALHRVGLGNRMKHFPTQLSGGQKQRVAIARAIVGKPEIVLADEPTGNLDSVMGNEIMDLLTNLQENEGTTIVMVTHDRSMANRTGRLIQLSDGVQVETETEKLVETEKQQCYDKELL